MKIIRPIILSLVLLFTLTACSNDGYTEGYSAGYADGFRAGIESASMEKTTQPVETVPSVESLPETEPSHPTEPQNTYPIVLAEDGEKIIIPDYNCTCPFEVIFPAGELANRAYFLFLEYICPFPEGKSSNVVTRYVEGGGTFDRSYDTRKFNRYSEWRIENGHKFLPVSNIGFFVSDTYDFSRDVPPGCYRLWYCSGEIWYGLDHYFGDDTVWYTSDEILTFYEEDAGFNGQVITLTLTPNGNFATYSADEEDLPDSLK